MTTHSERTCPICGQARKPSQLVPAEVVRGDIADLIRRDHPGWGGPGDVICQPDLNHYRTRFVEDLIAEEGRELTSIEQDVVEKLRTQELVSIDTNLELDRSLTFGERLADRVAGFGGSWAFILTFGAFLFVWMLINTIILFRRPFDPYPFILLNLILSTLAALQAPVIMMSQNRQEAKDRLRAEHDYRVNLKAELEIRLLSERVDALVTHQWQRLLEIQKIQLDLMEELDARNRNARRDKTES
ncbi:MAG TPA: DUF1003 domain-containing protein [Thermoanaerobaculia bacterium]|nr:DUF1003 domain-containing protein [Thermoanaerobaculia bacterium]